jgi:hypothetical protein
MALTPEQLQLKIASELNGSFDQLNRLRSREQLERFTAEEFAVEIALNWEMHAERGYHNLYVHYLFAKRQTVLWLMGQTWDEVSWQDSDAREEAEQAFSNLSQLVGMLDSDIGRYESRLAGANVLSGRMTAVTNIDSDANRPDPHDRRYRGDPLRPVLNPFYRGG